MGLGYPGGCPGECPGGYPGGVQGAPFPAAGLGLAVTLHPKPVSSFIRLACLAPLSVQRGKGWSGESLAGPRVAST